MGLGSEVASLDGPEYWSQELEISNTNKNGSRIKNINMNGSMNKNSRQQLQQQLSPPLKCPRCESSNTKFCYYNNYSRLQPRHYCKACKRHWTAGGTLRNVPVGGERKNKRLKTQKITTGTGTSSTENVILASSSTSGEQEERPFKDAFPQVVPQLDTEFRHPDMMNTKESFNTIFSSCLYPSGLVPEEEFVRVWGVWYEDMAGLNTSEFDMNL